MSDLLQKKKNLLEKSNAPKPNTTFSNSSIHSYQSKKENKTKTTTVRCTVDMSIRLSALVTTQGLESVNDLLAQMVDLYEGNLTSEERTEIRQIEKVLSRKKKN